MNRNKLAICLLLFLFCASCTKAQVAKIDTTVKMDTEGFRVTCNNKNADENTVSISPVGFKAIQNKAMFTVHGRVTKAMVDDMTDDGNPDVVICVYSGDNGGIGSVAGLSPGADKTLVPIYFPDIFLDPKLREGYKGYDEFSVMTGTLLRKFPLYLPGDAADKPTGGKRTVQYKAVNEQGRLTFKVLRSFDTKSQ